MPVEIKELVVRFRIEEKSSGAKNADAKNAELSSAMVKTLVGRCKEEVLRELERKYDR